MVPRSPTAILLCVLAVAAVALTWAGPARAKVTAYKPKTAAIVIDAASGRVLYARSADRLRHPASLTKMMTLFMAFDALEAGAVTLDTRIVVSARAAGAEPSKLGFEPGQSIALRDAIYALVTKSANDVAVALAEHLGGSEPVFAQMMTARARQLGMRRTVFRNASGLHDPRQVTTARDMATLAQAMMVHHARHYHYFGTKRFSYRGQSYRNHNRLMDTYPGMDGMKTGYISASGFNLTASAVRGGHRLIGVVFGGKTSKARNAEMARVLDKSFVRLGVDLGEPATRVASMEGVALRPTGLANVAPPPAKPRSRAVLMAMGSSAAVGQGDADPDAAAWRIAAGLAAVRAHRIAMAQQGRETAPWAIQVGAFSTQDGARRATTQAAGALPPSLRRSEHIVEPVQASGGRTLFRGRIGGYASRAEAARACARLSDCVAVGL